jgi:lipopolysaccharide transport system permease protein
MPLSTVLSNIVKFGIQFLLLLITMAWYYFNPSTLQASSTLQPFNHFNFFNPSTLLLLPLLVLIMAGLGLGIGIIISSMTTKYRDLTVLIGFAVQLLMYATPVVYPMSAITNVRLKFWISVNPLTPIMEAFRYATLGSGSFTLGGILYSTVFMIITLFLGLVIFSKVEKTFMDTV